VCGSLPAACWGYAILRGIQKGLKLPADKMMPSFASLRDFGNTSSASTWYTWAYIESTMGVKKAESVLQVGVGGGMKSGVAYWRALRSLKDIHPCWAHLGGVPLTEADLPRPISTDYKSVFDLPGTKSCCGAGAVSGCWCCCSPHHPGLQQVQGGCC